MSNSTDEAFTNVKGKTNFKQKNEDNLLASIEPETNLGFLSRNRDADISDLFYVRDAIEIDKNIENIMRAQEEEELARFRMSSIYRPAISSSKQMGSINIQRQDKGESTKLLSKVQMKLTKKRKVSDENMILDKAMSLKTLESINGKSDTITSLAIIKESIHPVPEEDQSKISAESNNALSGLMGAYDDEDSD